MGRRIAYIIVITFITITMNCVLKITILLLFTTVVIFKYAEALDCSCCDLNCQCHFTEHCHQYTSASGHKECTCKKGVADNANSQDFETNPTNSKEGRSGIFTPNGRFNGRIKSFKVLTPQKFIE